MRGLLATNYGRVKTIQLRVGHLRLPHPPHNPFTHPRVEYLDDGVPDEILLLVGFPRD
jgi:hypothetical protein